ncbi:MAG: HAMP domain-containing histidine kinase, partial [Acidobacteria bacterium]|nr:HAMP domain-containing histidine kinase [Acidobacteriota bacterium]
LLTSERAARAAAEEANRAKDTFLAMVTHELRAPLNTILGWTNMLGKGMLDAEKTKHAVAVIERGAKTQAQLVEDLLDISRIRTGKFRVNAQPVELSAVVEAAVESVAPAIAAKQIILHKDFGERVGLISGDAERLQQVVWNLLSNAVKFTPEKGHIEIRLERARTTARLTIYDNGAGIPREFLPFVFDSFRQSDETDKAKHKGLGLGLAIVRHLIEAHGGTVTATSAGENMGATFTVELPLLADKFHPAKQTESRNDQNLEYV